MHSRINNPLKRKQDRTAASNTYRSFSDGRNATVFTNRTIVYAGDWVYYVTNDTDDCAWQFDPSGGLTLQRDATILGLKTMVKLDSPLLDLVDLPPHGWHAW